MKLLKAVIPSKYKRQIKEMLGVPSLHWSLLNLKQNGFNPAVVIDIGAYEGQWTLDLLEVFSPLKILMVEAQKNKELLLLDIVKNKRNVKLEIALLSSRNERQMFFQENETASQIVTTPNPDFPSHVLLTATLDSLLQRIDFPFPDFLKLDVQGHELEVLKGAEKALESAEVCLLEISLLDLGENAPLLNDVLAFMDLRNFQAYDISQFMRRPFDKALFQIDMFFVKKDSNLVASKRWA